MLTKAKLLEKLQEINTRAIEIERLLSSRILYVEKQKYKKEMMKVYGLIRRRDPLIPVNDLLKEGKKEGLSKKAIMDCLELLRRAGDLFEPKRGFIQRT